MKQLLNSISDLLRWDAHRIKMALFHPHCVFFRSHSWAMRPQKAFTWTKNSSFFPQRLSIAINLLIFFGGAGTLSAQPLDSLLSLVRSNNPALRAGNFYYEAMRQRETQALQWPEPEFSLGFIAFPFPNRSFMPSATFGVMQPIPWKSLRQEKADVALSEAKVVLENIEIERLELLFSLKEAYWQLYTLEQSTLILSENLKLLGSLEKLAQTNLELGKGRLEDVLEVKMRMLELNQELQQAQNARRSPQSLINQILNRPATTPVAVEPTTLQPALFSFDSTAWEEVIAGFPGNMALEHEIQASRSKQALNRTEGRPSISAGLDYVLMNTGEGIHSTDGRDMLMPRIGVRLPLFRQTYLSRDEEERLRQAALADQQKSTSNTLLASVEQARAEWEDAQIQYRLVREQIPLIESALRLAETDLTTGRGSLDKSLRLYEQLLSARLKQVQAVSKSFIAIAAIQKWIK